MYEKAWIHCNLTTPCYKDIDCLNPIRKCFNMLALRNLALLLGWDMNQPWNNRSGGFLIISPDENAIDMIISSNGHSSNSAFINAGIQGCIAVADNAEGEPLTIHNCNTEDLPSQDWDFTFWTTTIGEESSGKNVGPQQIKVFRNKCIDVKDGINADGTKLQIWTCTEGDANQQWISDTDNTFQWSGTNKCIDLTDGKITDGNVLQIYTCDSKNSNQKWTNDPNPAAAELVHLTGGHSSDTDGAEVALVACLNSEFHATFPDGNITWSVPIEPLTGPVKTFNNKCLDVESYPPSSLSYFA
ncbi:ricin B lectin domain-containing protein [Mycena capillaripes]|nr:ricin B lectin domain-containing protein [Mycena capillaripes]